MGSPFGVGSCWRAVRSEGPVRLKSRKYSDKLSTIRQQNRTLSVKTPKPARPRGPRPAAAPAGPGGGAGEAKQRSGGIVSSSHLVSPRSVELSEFEFGLIVAWNAFSRWAIRCMAAAGCPDLTITDVLVLHHINHRARNKKLADICFVLNYEDTHVVAYSLKKLVAAGMAQGDRQGKEVFYSPTPAGEAAVQQYRTVREACLVDNLALERNHDIGEVARLLRSLSGLYDQAARAATSL